MTNYKIITLEVGQINELTYVPHDLSEQDRLSIFRISIDIYQDGKIIEDIPEYAITLWTEKENVCIGADIKLSECTGIITICYGRSYEA